MIKNIILVLGIGAGCMLAAPLPDPPLQDNLDRGVELYRDKQYADAEKVLEQATQDDASHPKAWTYLGLTRLELKEYESSLEPFSKAISLDEEATEAHYGMGLAQAHLGRVDDAIAHLERAVKLNPTHAYGHYYLGLAYNERDQADRTLLHLQRFVELRPNAPEAEKVKALLARLR